MKRWFRRKGMVVVRGEICKPRRKFTLDSKILKPCILHIPHLMFPDQQQSFRFKPDCVRDFG